MKAPSGRYKIIRVTDRRWEIRVVDMRTRAETGKVAWRGRTFIGARNAHYRMSVADSTGKPVSYAQARRAGNA